MWTLVRESSAFFSKGHATFDEWTAADNGAIADTIQTFAAKSKLIERKMQDVHSLVPKVSCFLKLKVGYLEDYAKSVKYLSSILK